MICGQILLIILPRVSDALFGANCRENVVVFLEGALDEFVEGRFPGSILGGIPDRIFEKSSGGLCC